MKYKHLRMRERLLIRTIDNDQTALKEQIRLSIDARERDMRVNNDPNSRYSSYSANENAVDYRIKQLISDIDYRDRIIAWIRETITDRSQSVHSACAAIIEGR